MARQAGAVLQCLARTANQLLAEDKAAPEEQRAFAEEAPQLRLATAIAEGSDRFVAQAALDQGYELNLIFPFPKSQYRKDFTGDALTEFEAMCASPSVASCTELDFSSPPP